MLLLKFKACKSLSMGCKHCNATLIQFARMLVKKNFFFLFSQGGKKSFTERAYPGVNYKALPRTLELHKLKCNYHLGRKRESLFFTFSARDYPFLEVHERSLAESNLYFMQTTKTKLYIFKEPAECYAKASLQMPISSPIINETSSHC